MSTKKAAKNSNKSAAPAAPKKDNGPSVRVQYDKEQYEAHYTHMANNLVKVYPTLRCFGQKAPPTAKGMMIAFLIFGLQAFLAFGLHFGESFLLNNFGYVLDPTISQFMKDYQMMLMLPIVFITPLMQYASRNGAFEIHLNDQLIYSKYETNQLPSVAYVKDLLAKKGLKPKAE
ncbi:Aste57867_13668 [Aphanomyces stellatus]|uniref:Aste57867_13668 protein n=1 Tax=Aphanomyces stellatus TaxID=120398 RepID=A0A485KZM0_9STRA|nr:hypothetical protein As57867_013618 [Aphanomyces stellatus]VFT90502.1 Aste57867_13668 [Aphanomyces stellatus]